MRFIIAILFIATTTIAQTQQSMATLKAKFNKAELINEDTVVQVLHPSDTFLVYQRPSFKRDYYPVWTEEGGHGNLPKEKVKLIPEKLNFKLKVNPDKIIESACSDHSMNNFKLIDVNYCKLMKKIVVEKSDKALKYFLSMGDTLEAALSAIHGGDSWQILNYYTDIEFYDFLTKLSKKQRARITYYYLKSPTESYPISNQYDYIKKFYPLTWSVFKKHIK